MGCYNITTYENRLVWSFQVARVPKDQVQLPEPHDAQQRRCKTGRQDRRLPLLLPASVLPRRARGNGFPCLVEVDD